MLETGNKLPVALRDVGYSVLWIRSDHLEILHQTKETSLPSLKAFRGRFWESRTTSKGIVGKFKFLLLHFWEAREPKRQVLKALQKSNEKEGSIAIVLRLTQIIYLI